MSEIFLNDNNEMNPPNKVGYRYVNRYIALVVIALLLALVRLIKIPIAYKVKKMIIYIKGMMRAHINLK